MLSKSQVMEYYLMNSKEVLAEMLYDTITKYESRLCDNCGWLDKDLICVNESSACYSEYSGRYDNFGCSEFREKVW